jgi:hypothetical protein
MSDLEVPDPDAFEQALIVDEDDVAAVLAPPSLDPEAPEADAMEQARIERLADEDDLR